MEQWCLPPQGSAAFVCAISTTCSSPTGEGECSLDGVDLSDFTPTILVRQQLEVTPELIISAGSSCTVEELEDLSYSSDAPSVARCCEP